jgi:hypothetical protein
MNQIQISILYEYYGFVFVYNVHLHEIVKLRKSAKKSLPTCPTYGVSWQLTILHCSKISRSNFENLQLSIS